MEKSREEFLNRICEEQPYKIVMSNPVLKTQEVRKIVWQLMQGKRSRQYQIEKFTDKQAFHINIEERGLKESLQPYFGVDYLQLSAWTKDWEYQAKISKKGKLLWNRRANKQAVEIRQGNNKEKQYCIPEGTVIPPLIDMGVFTKEGKIVKSRYDKYRQINRFLEMVEDALKTLPEGPLNIIDFGCGKSYLTFLLYYYMTEVKKRQVHITGLDLKKTVIEECQRTAETYHYENLEFQVGDISGYETKETVHMVITLHACDTATDYALYHAVRWNTKVILSVPCCQHEVNRQMHPDKWKLLSRYGIVQERTAALMTDAMRGNLLEYCGYKTQLLEFIDIEHSPKNILIRAVKADISEKKRQEALEEVQEMMQVLNVKPTLYKLLIEGEKHE